VEQDVSTHYGGGRNLLDKIETALRQKSVEPHNLKSADLEALDEFHFRGRAATLELLARLNVTANSHILDIGSGLGGVARTIADMAGCRVTGIDLTQEFCDAATAMSQWVQLGDRTEFRQGDATNLPFADNRFDHAITVHVAMNIPQKNKMYEEARRVLRPRGLFAIYDILQGEGGEVLYPTPWALEPSISHLATPEEMETLLSDAGFKILEKTESTRVSLEWLKARTASSNQPNILPVTTRLLFGDTSLDMVGNQLRGLEERRMLTCSYICEA
jgi:ubiquinone/menaquinone biosynthesis C-methylase UbiE